MTTSTVLLEESQRVWVYGANEKEAYSSRERDGERTTRAHLESRATASLHAGMFRFLLNHAPNQTVDLPWSGYQHATPLADMHRVAVGDTTRGIPFAFADGATVQLIVRNENSDDAGGLFARHGIKPASVWDLYQAVAQDFAVHPRNHPVPNIFDEGYYDDAGKFATFIPKGVVLIMNPITWQAAVLHVLPRQG